jgi:hypothetical protein
VIATVAIPAPTAARIPSTEPNKNGPAKTVVGGQIVIGFFKKVFSSKRSVHKSNFQLGSHWQLAGANRVQYMAQMRVLFIYIYQRH